MFKILSLINCSFTERLKKEELRQPLAYRNPFLSFLINLFVYSAAKLGLYFIRTKYLGLKILKIDFLILVPHLFDGKVFECKMLRFLR